MPFELQAGDDWGLCRIPIIEQSSNSSKTSSSDIFIESDYLETLSKQQLLFQGDVALKQHHNSIEAQQLKFDQSLNLLTSDSTSIFTNNNSTIQSSSFSFNNDSQSGVFSSPKIQLLASHRFINAQEVIQLNEFEQQFKGFRYTSCEPNDSAWALTSNDIVLNHQTGLGTAKHAKVYFFDVPIFYFPYFQFPIDDLRHSGVLMPSFSLSSSKGNGVSLPIYWNIHPQLDSTIELNQNSLRGLQGNTQTRYLTTNSSGVLNTSDLDDKEENQHRYFYKLSHQTEFNKNTSLTVLAQKVSEQQFFNDFSSYSLAKTPDYLERKVELKHNAGTWNNALLFQHHQTLDESKSIASRPYSQWPKLSSSAQFDFYNQQLDLNLNQSLIAFDKDDSINGERLIFNPVFSSSWSNSYAFLKPQISFSYSQYQIQNIDQSEDSFNRALTTISLDSGLFFERIASTQNAWLQTLEPRLFYLKTPYKDQSHIPDFDSANLSASYANLFKTNRFSGGDRIGDTEQLTLGLSSSLLSLDSGLEILRLSLGQTLFLKDRQVQLSGSALSSEDNSDLFAEISTHFDPYWSLSANITQQAETHFIRQKTLQLSFNNKNQVFNLSYRFKGIEDNTELEQTDVSMVYPINPSWKAFAKRQYSIIDKHYVEQLWGASYESCCWAFSIMAVESADDDFIEVDRSVYFQLTFKGLTNVGRNNDDLLQKSIPNYLQ